MPGKSKMQIAKEKRKANLDRRTRKNMKNSVDRPKQKQKPKSQLKKKIKKGFEDFTRGLKKGLKNPITAPIKIIKDKITSGSKAKASTTKPKKKSKMQEGQAYQPTRTSNRQPGIKKANERKEASREALQEKLIYYLSNPTKVIVLIF